MNFIKRTITTALLCVGLAACVLPSLPARAQLLSSTQVNPNAPNISRFANVPNFVGTSGLSNLVASYTNAYRLKTGKGLGLGAAFGQGSNAQSGTMTFYYGLVFNRTNTSSYTNFSWSAAFNGSSYTKIFTNIPAAVVDNADGVFVFAVQSSITNSTTNLVHTLQQGN